MIHYICREAEQDTIAPFLYTAGAELGPHLRITTYEELFAERALAPGHLIFTDFDRMTVYEIETAQTVARRMREAVPGAAILNEPAAVLQRYPLLTTLWREGVNPFRAARLDEGFPDLDYPVFIRREDEARGPETDLLHSEDELRAAIDRLKASGRPLRGRLAVEYCAERSADGYFRKYGAFRVADRILPQHLQFAEQWVVKAETWKIGEAQVAEELDYIRSNPHRDQIKAIFDHARIEYGRIDYSLVGGRLVAYEINTNATFSRVDKRDLRQERRTLVRRRLTEALKSLDAPLPQTGRVRFEPPEPRIHPLPVPRAPHKSAWRLLGKSPALDLAIHLYWRILPKTMRQKLPDGLKTRLKHVLGRTLQRKYG